MTQIELSLNCSKYFICFNRGMTIKGFTENTNNIETPNDINVSEKPLNPKKISSGRVDINVLKSKLEAQQGKEFRKNVFIFSFCVLLLGSIGIFLSL